MFGDTIIAIDLGRHNSAARVYDRRTDSTAATVVSPGAVVPFLRLLRACALVVMRFDVRKDRVPVCLGGPHPGAMNVVGRRRHNTWRTDR